MTHTHTHTHASTHKRSSYTQAVTHGRFYTQTLIHTQAFTRIIICYTQTLLHTASFYIQGKRGGTGEQGNTQTLLHTEAVTHTSFYTQKLLPTEVITQTTFYTQNTATHTHTCSETSYRITDVECIVRAENTPVNLTGDGEWPGVRNSVEEFCRWNCNNVVDSVFNS